MSDEHKPGYLWSKAAIALVLVWGAAGSGCSSTTPPDLVISEVTISEQSPEAMVLNFAMEGANENPDPLPLGEVRYRLDLDGTHVFSGVRSAQMTIPRRGSAMIDLPASFRLNDLGVDLQGRTPYRLSGSIRYRPDGTFPGVMYDSDLHRPARTFSISGVLDFDPVMRTGPFQDEQADPATIRIDEPSGL